MYLSKKDTDTRCSLVFFRSFDIVPEPVIVVCECMAIIRGYTEVDWEVAKGMMEEPNFLQNLRGVNCDLITGTQIRAIKTHMKVM
jgi:dynein heavy chain